MNKAMYQPAFSVVFGYVPRAEPRRAASENLRRKLSLVLSTHNPETGEMFFDFKLASVLLRFTLSKFDINRVILRLDEKEDAVFESVESLNEYLENELYNEAENELPFQQIICLKDEKPVVLILPEDFTGSGGPEPYHDSMTYTFLYESLDLEDYLHGLRKRCGAASLKINAIIHGNETPETGWLQRLKSRFLAGRRPVSGKKKFGKLT